MAKTIGNEKRRDDLRDVCREVIELKGKLHFLCSDSVREHLLQAEKAAAEPAGPGGRPESTVSSLEEIDDATGSCSGGGYEAGVPGLRRLRGRGGPRQQAAHRGRGTLLESIRERVIQCFAAAGRRLEGATRGRKVATGDPVQDVLAVGSVLQGATRGRKVAAGDPVQDMLAVGSVYEGDIVIPGFQKERQIYTLEVLCNEVDALGQPCILGKHTCYGDMCHILISTDGHCFSYADSETQCSGVMDLEARTISGKVCQLVNAQEGFYQPFDGVTHTFRLALQRSSAAEKATRAALCAARQRRLFLLQQGEMGRDKRALLADLTLDSLEVLQDAVDAVQAECALRRRQASLLQASSFASVAEREEHMAALTSKGFSRAAAHERASTVMASFAMIDLIDRGGPNGPIKVKLEHERQKALRALEVSFCILDKSLQGAEQRLGQDVLAAWRGVGEGGGQCMICLLDIHVHEPALRLPCAHTFHDQCGTEWLHTNTTCPNCRCDVSKEAEELELKAEWSGEGRAGGTRAGRRSRVSGLEDRV